MAPRYCKTCNSTHEPPTGKKCRTPPSQEDTLQQILQQVTGLRTDFDHLSARVADLESPDTAASANDSPSGGEDDQDDTESRDGNQQSALPTVASLRHDQNLQNKVAQRIRAINDLHLLTGESSESDNDESSQHHKSSKGKKSGKVRTVSDMVLKHIDWPHFYVYRGPDRQAAKYVDLSVQEFVFGFMCIIRKTKSPDKELMLNHLQELMEDAVTYGWESVRNYHSIILQHMEMKRIGWRDTEAIQKLRRTYAMQTPMDKFKMDSTARRQTKGPMFCLSFQSNKCNESTDHASSRGFVKHICAYCLKQVGQEYNHSETDCRRKKKANTHDDEGSKND